MPYFNDILWPMPIEKQADVNRESHRRKVYNIVQLSAKSIGQIVVAAKEYYNIDTKTKQMSENSRFYL